MNDELDNPNSKYLFDIYSDDIENNIVEMNLVDSQHQIAEWLDGIDKVDPDFCRYMGMTLLSLANKLES
ncbi:hypothetical protein JKI99_11550 [Acinetobacter nectaris]|nr:hypothetical protein [Acinetobacter nectaris]